MLVQRGVVNGRIGNVKIEASNDDVPRDPGFAQVLLDLEREKTSGLVFPSHITGGCYDSGVFHQQILEADGEKIGLFGIGWHVFRRTYRSFVDPTGAPIGVQQKLMRHSNLATTRNVYGNATFRARQKANSKVVQIVVA
jgi:integrase